MMRLKALENQKAHFCNISKRPAHLLIWSELSLWYYPTSSNKFWERNTRYLKWLISAGKAHIVYEFLNPYTLVKNI